MQWRIQDFPLGGGGGGGADPLGEVPTSNPYTFWQKHMRKRKKWILLGGGGGGGAAGAPLDPPMRCLPILINYHVVY